MIVWKMYCAATRWIAASTSDLVGTTRMLFVMVAGALIFGSFVVLASGWVFVAFLAVTVSWPLTALAFRGDQPKVPGDVE